MSVERPPLPVIDFERIGPPVGERFLDITLPNQAGELIDLHSDRGNRRALVVFHRSAGW